MAGWQEILLKWRGRCLSVSRWKGTMLKNFFYFLITYGVCTKRKYYNRMSETKKNSLLLTNVHDFYVLDNKTSQKKFPSVCLSVCLDIWMYVRTWTFHVDTITFEGVSYPQTKFRECLPCMKCRSGIEIQSNIIILILMLILNRILIFTKTLRSDTKFGGYL